MNSFLITSFTTITNHKITIKMKNLKLIVFLLSLTLFKCSDNEETSTTNPITEPITEIIKKESDTVAKIDGLGFILRTPEERFENLKDYNFKSNYVFLEGDDKLRMHYLDEGPKTGKLIVLMHGNPAWVYNFRKIIPPLVAQGYRVICPDLIGFGKSDKPVERSAHTYDNQVKWVEKFIDKLDLSNINLHVQDWGGLIGMRVAIRNQSLFSKIAISNTALLDGTNVTEAFKNWKIYSQRVPDYSSVIESSTFVELELQEEQGYDAPFPEERFKAGPRELPFQVPTDPTSEEALENKIFNAMFALWKIPIVTIFSEDDTITTGEEEKIKQNFIGAKDQPHTLLKEASHFIREDQPEEMAKLLGAFFK
jgi:haloalkane dehalogenase